MGDKRTDPGHYYPGGKVRAKSGTAPQELIVQWSDVQGKPQIAPLPDRYRDSDVKGKIDEIASKFATIIVVALIGWTACADITVQKKRKDQIYNDDQVVVDVSGDGVGMNTNAVIDIANATIATNPVVAAKLDKADVIDPLTAMTNGPAADAKATADALAGKMEPGDEVDPVFSGWVTGDNAKTWLENNETDPTVADWARSDQPRPEESPIVPYPIDPTLAEKSQRAEIAYILYNGIDEDRGIMWNHGKWYVSDDDYTDGFYLEPAPDISGKFDTSRVSSTDPTFTNAVLQTVIPNLSTNITAEVFIAATNACANLGIDPALIPQEGTLGTVGGLLLALAAAVALLRKKTKLLKSDGTAEDDFATDLMGKQVAIDALKIPLEAKADSFVAEDGHAYAVTMTGTVTITMPTVTEGKAAIFQARFSAAAQQSVQFSTDAVIKFDGADCGVVKAGKDALLSAMWNGTAWDLVWKNQA